MFEYFDLSNEVSIGLQKRQPIVLIESTVWLQGLPKDIAFKTLSECDIIIREEGVIPAVTVLKEGKITVGISSYELREISKKVEHRKTNLRDIPAILEKKQLGGTTVSATLFIADKLGLPVCLTGGIGGVHRFASKTFDISADLIALSQYPLCLVSSGIKSILDIKATLEKLETLAVPVLTLGTNFFPSFHCLDKKYATPQRVDSLSEIANIYMTSKRLNLNKGILIANPIPKEDSISSSLIDEITEKAIVEAQELNIDGKEVTPFLLERLNKKTLGESVRANVALLKNNAKVAAKLVKEILSHK